MLDNVQLLGDAESALSSDQSAMDALNYSPIDRIIFASVFQSPNVLSQFARARIRPVVDALIVDSEPILESGRCEANIWSNQIVCLVDNISVIYNVTFQTMSAHWASFRLPAIA